MAFSESLAQRVRYVLHSLTTAEEKKMFGGIAFMVSGNMTVGVIQENLIARVGLENYEAALDKPDTDLFKPTGKPMAGWVVVAPNGHRADEALKYWIELALEFVKTLPAK
ncbi:MAG: TfoX/Sxy family protein [Anaerolineales bacterium]|jgi:TfoX/Sxy family transcriptional regulator of competence genes